jgi:lysophospholipase L1-like esterase
MGLLAREYRYNEVIDFNNDLKAISNHYNYEYIDLFDTEIKDNLNRYCDYIADGNVHPSKLGMNIIANRVIEKLLSK